MKMFNRNPEFHDKITRYMKMIKQLLNSDVQDFYSAREKVPKVPGVYLILEKFMRRFLYIGESGDLRRRLLGDHKSGNREGSAFRKALSIHEKLGTERDISKYILENCSFQFLRIPKKLERKRFEHFAIAVLQPLLYDVVIRER